MDGVSKLETEVPTALGKFPTFAELSAGPLFGRA